MSTIPIKKEKIEKAFNNVKHNALPMNKVECRQEVCVGSNPTSGGYYTS